MYIVCLSSTKHIVILVIKCNIYTEFTNVVCIYYETGPYGFSNEYATKIV